MQIAISNKLTMSDVPEYLATDIQDWLAFANPKFGKNEKLNRFYGAIPDSLIFF